MPKHRVYLIPLIVGLVLAFALAAGLHLDQQHCEQESRLAVFDRLSTLRGGLENALLTRLNLMDALKTYVRINPDLDRKTFAALAEGLTGSVGGIRVVALARRNAVTLVHPPGRGAELLGKNLFTDGPEGLSALANRALQSRQLRIAEPPREDGRADRIIAAAPVFLTEGKAYWGMALLYIDAATLFREAGLPDTGPGLRTALKTSGPAPGVYRVLFGSEAVFAENPVQMSIPVPGGGWQLAAVPERGWARSPNRAAILYGGSALVLVIVGLLFSTLSLLTSRLRARDEYRHLVENARSIILRIDRQGAITYCNEYAETFYGYARGELPGRALVGSLVPPASPAGELLARSPGRLFRNPDSLAFAEFLTVRKSGEAVWISWAHEPVLSDSGETDEILSVGTDITDRKFMEEALRQRERQYRLLAENVTDIIFGLDADLRYTFVSPSDEVARGFKRGDVLGRPLVDFLNAPSLPRFADAAARLKETGGDAQRSAILDLEFLCADGSTLWLETRLGPLHNDDGDVIGILGVSRDITDRKLADALREDVERMARHDLKTPLGAVIGLPGEIRLMGPLNRSQEALLSTVEKAGRAMLERINSSLNLYKMEQGGYELNRAPVNVVSVLHGIRDESMPLIREKGISLGLEVLGGDGEHCTALVDEPLFRSMLSNLLLNALQASPEGGAVTVSLTCGPPLCIVIRNQGAVPLSVRETFFEKYATADSANGTGLGTYSARLIARTHGGDIELDTGEPGRTTVTVLLP